MFFGLDISEGSLRLIQLKRKGKKILLASYNNLNIKPGTIINGEIKKEEELIKTVHKLIKTAKGEKINTKDVITVLPESKTFIKVMEIKTSDKKKIVGVINNEIKNHIPLTPEEIYLDWQILHQGPDITKLLIGAAPRNITNSYTTALEKSGLNPNILEIEGAAITRGLLDKEDSKSKIIIDIGAVRTGLIVYDHATIQFTVSLPLSGNKITETISKTLKLDMAKAEKAKVVCGIDSKKCEGALLKILIKSLDNLASQIKKSITFYQDNFPNSNPPTEIILCGGGANLDKIDQFISKKLNIPVKIGNPLNNIQQNRKISIPQNKILSYTTAIGLALREFQKKK